MMAKNTKRDSKVAPELLGKMADTRRAAEESLNEKMLGFLREVGADGTSVELASGKLGEEPHNIRRGMLRLFERGVLDRKVIYTIKANQPVGHYVYWLKAAVGKEKRSGSKKS
jgi:hypothetical protein